MTAYIDRQWVYNELGQDRTEALLSRGGTSSGSYGTKLDQFISESSSRFKGFIKVRGATVGSVTDDVKGLVGGLVVDKLFARAGQADLPAAFQDLKLRTVDTLQLYSEGKTDIDGLTYDSNTHIGSMRVKYALTGSNGRTDLHSVQEYFDHY